MKAQVRNLVPFWYCTFKAKEPIRDAEGNLTGEYRVTYNRPVQAFGVLSPARGYAQITNIGTAVKYDKTILTYAMNLPIDEQTVLFVEDPPEDRESYIGYNYNVTMVARSMNYITYAIAKVTSA